MEKLCKLFYQIKCEMQKCGNVFFIFHPFRIPVMTRGIKTSGPKKRPVIGCPSFWLLAHRKQVSPGIQTLNHTLVNQNTTLEIVFNIIYFWPQVPQLCTPSWPFTPPSPATSPVQSPLRRSSTLTGQITTTALTGNIHSTSFSLPASVAETNH